MYHVSFRKRIVTCRAIFFVQMGIAHCSQFASKRLILPVLVWGTPPGCYVKKSMYAAGVASLYKLNKLGLPCRKKLLCQNNNFLHTSVSEKEHLGMSAVANKYSLRSHTCGELCARHVNEKVKLYGWVQYQRMGRFVTLRDRYGVTQLIVPDVRNDLRELLNSLPYESVIAAEGTVHRRPQGQENVLESTGEIEVVVEKLIVLNVSKPQLPFSIREHNKAKESLLMKYRYLALRFPHLQNNLLLRSKLLMRMREYLCYECDFVEVETPTLFRRTPGVRHCFGIEHIHPYISLF